MCSQWLGLGGEMRRDICFALYPFLESLSVRHIYQREGAHWLCPTQGRNGGDRVSCRPLSF
jgi:hypothetical protein